MSRKEKKPKDPGTTGHSWDGIEELNNPLPRWWLWTFYATIIWGIGYTVLYPAWPLVSGATPGLLGYSSRQEVQTDIANVTAANAAIDARLMSTDLNAVADDPTLQRYATAGGGALFKTYCSQCHGSGAAGNIGYPNLLDDDWLWGGTLSDINTTISHGVRWDQDPDTRFSQMPAFGEILSAPEITQVVEYVRALSNQENDPALAAKGQEVFANNCSACHGEKGTGGQDLGAPNLTDPIWLYGGDRKTLTTTVTKARYGMMPAWSQRLDPSQVRQLAVYVHQLGGGQ